MSTNSLHSYYLQQMGIETWHIRQSATLHNPSVKLMLIGESFGSDLFAGKAGGLLSKMLNTIGITVDEVCFVPVSTINFTDTLQQTMKKSSPHMLFAMGHIAALNTMRGRISDYHGTPIIESFHPNELLMHPAHKKSAYQDLLCVQQLLAHI